MREVSRSNSRTKVKLKIVNRSDNKAQLLPAEHSSSGGCLKPKYLHKLKLLGFLFNLKFLFNKNSSHVAPVAVVRAIMTLSTAFR